MPENMIDQTLFGMFYTGLRRANFSSEQETNYFNDVTTQRDINNQIKFAQDKGYAEGEAKGYAAGQARGLADGHAEGHAEGLSEGETKGKMDDARAMLADGLGIDKVEKYTGLSKESLEALLAEIQKLVVREKFF